MPTMSATKSNAAACLASPRMPFSSPGRLMRILRSIVAPSTAFMAFSDSKITR